jgi:hypothetical protein
MKIYSWLLFHSYYFFKKQGRFQPLDLCSYFLVFYVAPIVFSLILAIHNRFNLLSSHTSIVIAIAILISFFVIQKKVLIPRAFKGAKKT